MKAEENHASGGVDDDGAGGEVVGETLAAGTVRVGFEVGEEVVAQRELGGVRGGVGVEEAEGVGVVLRGSCASGWGCSMLVRGVLLVKGRGASP
jgi:hypothetical protein